MATKELGSGISRFSQAAAVAAYSIGTSWCCAQEGVSTVNDDMPGESLAINGDDEYTGVCLFLEAI
jgi:hypothetical protein